MNRYNLLHTTEFKYDGPVSESYNEVRLRPLHDEKQSCLSFRLVTNPASRGMSYRDAYGNSVHQFNIMPEHRHLKIEAESVVLVHDAPLLPTNSIMLANVSEATDALTEEFWDFMMPSGYVPHLSQLDSLITAASELSDGSVSGFSTAASNLIHARFEYVKGATHVNSSILDSLSIGAGVCQDFAHVLLGVLRKRGLPGRYVSGYMVPEGSGTPNSKLQQVIGGYASHAWVEVYIPEAGWFGLDPTLGQPVSLQHIRIAYGRDYGDVAPVRGVYNGRAGQRLSVDVRVRPELDDGGREQLSENKAISVEKPIIEMRVQQPAQQQMQQQQ